MKVIRSNYELGDDVTTVLFEIREDQHILIKRNGETGISLARNLKPDDEVLDLNPELRSRQ